MSKISQEKIDYINTHLDMHNNELAKILNISRDTVRKYKKEQNVFYQPKKFHEYDDYIIEHYYDKTSTELAQEIGCSRSYITKIWRENNLFGKSQNRYHMDENYFKNIDTGDKAYLLGLLASDGCLYKRDGHQGLIQISLQKKDQELLQNILEVLKSNYPININQNMATISLTSDKMFNDLSAIGLHPKKTWTINMKEVFSNIPDIFHKDFFRGYFDGDGTITSSDNFITVSRTKIGYVCPLTTAEVFQKILLQNNIESSFYLNSKEKYSKDFGSIEFTNTTFKYCFLKWIYANSNLKLKRKYELSKNFVNKVEGNITNRSENLKALKYYQEVVLNE